MMGRPPYDHQTIRETPMKHGEDSLYDVFEVFLKNSKFIDNPVNDQHYKIALAISWYYNCEKLDCFLK